MKHKGFFLLFIGLVLSDQLSKQIFMSSFDLGQSMVLNPYLSWTYLHNTGAAFSILSDGGVVQKLFLLGVSTLVSLWLVWWTQRTSEIYRQKLLGQFFLLSGAVGNLIDICVKQDVGLNHRAYLGETFNDLFRYNSLSSC